MRNEYRGKRGLKICAMTNKPITHNDKAGRNATMLELKKNANWTSTVATYSFQLSKANLEDDDGSVQLLSSQPMSNACGEECRGHEAHNSTTNPNFKKKQSCRRSTRKNKLSHTPRRCVRVGLCGFSFLLLVVGAVTCSHTDIIQRTSPGKYVVPFLA